MIFEFHQNRHTQNLGMMPAVMASMSMIKTAGSMHIFWFLFLYPIENTPRSPIKRGVFCI